MQLLSGTLCWGNHRITVSCHCHAKVTTFSSLGSGQRLLSFLSPCARAPTPPSWRCLSPREEGRSYLPDSFVRDRWLLVCRILVRNDWRISTELLIKACSGLGYCAHKVAILASLPAAWPADSLPFLPRSEVFVPSSQPIGQTLLGTFAYANGAVSRCQSKWPSHLGQSS